jgi:hypothetical protein
MRASASEAAQAEVVRYCPKSDHIADMERASVPERGSNAGPAKPRLEFYRLEGS